MAQPVLFVVEGERDAAILRKLLPESLSTARFFAARGRASIATVARNLLVHENGPVMLVADGDTHDADRLREDRANLQLALRNVAPAGRFGIFLFVPEIEVLFFECPQALAELPMDADRDVLSLRYGKDVPKRALEAMLDGQSFDTWLAGLNPEIWDLLRGGDQAQKLLSAVQALVDDSDQLLRR